MCVTLLCVIFSSSPVVDMSLHGDHGSGAAKGRRDRRLRMHWRHELLALQMALAAALHHSRDVGPVSCNAPPTKRLPVQGVGARDELYGDDPGPSPLLSPPPTTTTTLVSPSSVPLAVDIMDVDSAATRGGTGSARRRRERRLRQHWRHEQLTLQMLLATYQHHAAPRGQTTARSGEWGSELNYTATFRRTPPPQAAGAQYFAMDVDEVPAAGGSRPDRLAPVSGPQERVLRHTVEQAGDVVPGLPALDAPVPQMVDKLEDVLKIVDLFVPAQEIEVPRISSPSCPPPRRFFLCRRRQNSWWKCHCRPLVLCRHGFVTPMAMFGHASGTPRGVSSGGAWTHATSSGAPRRGSPPAQGGI